MLGVGLFEGLFVLTNIVVVLGSEPNPVEVKAYGVEFDAAGSFIRVLPSSVGGGTNSPLKPIHFECLIYDILKEIIMVDTGKKMPDSSSTGGSNMSSSSSGNDAAARGAAGTDIKNSSGSAGSSGSMAEAPLPLHRLRRPKATRPWAADASGRTGSTTPAPGSMGGSFNQTQDSVKETVEQVKDTAHGTIDKVAEAVTPTIDKLCDTAHKVVDKVSTVAEAAAPTIDKLSDTAHKVEDKVSTVAEAAAPTINKLSDTAHKVMDKVSSGASQATAMMQEKTPQMKDHQNNVMADTLVRIRENPVTAVVIAAGAGYFLARLFNTAHKVVDKVSTVT